MMTKMRSLLMQTQRLGKNLEAILQTRMVRFRSIGGDVIQRDDVFNFDRMDVVICLTFYFEYLLCLILS